MSLFNQKFSRGGTKYQCFKKNRRADKEKYQDGSVARVADYMSKGL